jgi:hypothetical protein
MLRIAIDVWFESKNGPTNELKCCFVLNERFA